MLVAFAAPGAGAADVRAARNAIGYDVDLAALPSPHPRPRDHEPVEGAAPVHVRIRVPWSLIEKSPGVQDWATLDTIVRTHAAAGYVLIVEPHGGDPHARPSAEAEAAREAFLGALARRYRDAVSWYLLGRDGASAPAREAAFRIKTASVRIRGESPEAGIALIAGPPGETTARRIEALYEEGVAVYVDAVAIVDAPGGDVDTGLAAIRARMLLHDPSAAVWWIDTRITGRDNPAGRLLRAYLAGLARECDLTVAALDWSGGVPLVDDVIHRIRGTFLQGFSNLVTSGRPIDLRDPMGRDLPVTTLRLYDPEGRRALVAYDGGEGSTRGVTAVMTVDTADVAEPRLHDVAAGETGAVGGWQIDEAAGLTRIALPVADYPILLSYRRFTSPFFGQEETLEISAQRLPSVEEILAAHQAHQAAQDAVLVNLRADARVDYHFTIGQGTPFDVTILNTFYWDPDTGAEFEQRDFLVNGVAWRSKRIPQFPLPQPEKVLTLPLDILLDKRYTYRLEGEEAIDGRETWEIAFEPIDAASSLYRGRVWIDKATGARVRIRSLQTGLQEPILSNDEIDTYRPLKGPDGIDHWVLDRITGQQVFSTVGRNLVLSREVTFTNHVINDPGFEERRAEAYASDRQIIRDTEKGMRYLERTPDGGRVVQEEFRRDSLFLLGGAFWNRSFDFPVPLAGVNYFHRDLFGRGLQTNVFFAGVFLFANLTDPDFLGTGLDASVDIVGQGIAGTDRPVLGGEEREEENVDTATQAITLGIGLPFAEHFKVKWTGRFQYETYSRDEETEGGFRIPVDTLVSLAGMQGEFNRRDWAVRASVEVGRRSDWEPWGPAGALSRDGSFIETTRDFVRYEGGISKNWYLPYNQRLTASVNAYGGEDLDRFSKFGFDFFGNRVRGLSGTGLRYSHGWVGRVGYAFNLGEFLRFGATVDHARISDRESPPDGDRRDRDFTGLGISGQTIVGPNLILSLDWGIALASDFDEFDGEQEILISILRFLR